MHSNTQRSSRRNFLLEVSEPIFPRVTVSIDQGKEPSVPPPLDSGILGSRCAPSKIQCKNQPVIQPSGNADLRLPPHVSRVNYRFPERGSIKYRFLVAHMQPAAAVSCTSASTRRGSMSCSHLMSCIRMHRFAVCTPSWLADVRRVHSHTGATWEARTSQRGESGFARGNLLLTSRCCRCHGRLGPSFLTVATVSTDEGTAPRPSLPFHPKRIHERRRFLKFLSVRTCLSNHVALATDWRTTTSDQTV